MELRKAHPDVEELSSVIFDDEGPYMLRALPGSAAFYFEVTLLSAPARECTNCEVLVGFVGRACSSMTLPGWEKPSASYTASGSLVLDAGELEDYGAAWRAGDTVGAGVDYERRKVFFTHNGVRYKDVNPEDWSALQLACVGLGNAATSERVRLNFGASSFVYDHAKWSSSPAASLSKNARTYPLAVHNTECSWVVTFDSPSIMRRTEHPPRKKKPQAAEEEEEEEEDVVGTGCVVLGAEERYKLRRLDLGPGAPSLLFAEFKVLDAGESNDVTVGFVDEYLAASGGPGDADTETIGWRADGAMFINGTDHAYGPRWAAGDVVGLALDSEKKVAFFMINGRRLKDIDLAVDAPSLDRLAVHFGGAATSERVELNLGVSLTDPLPAGSLTLPSAFKFPPSPAQAVVASFPQFSNSEGDKEVYMRGSQRHCSWVVQCDAPLILRRAPQKPSKSDDGDDSFVPGSLVFVDPAFALRPLDEKGSSPDLLYFEMTVTLAPGSAKDSYIDVAIGFAGEECRIVDGQPGDLEGSVGFSSAGNILSADEDVAAEEYSPAWKSGDVIGAALDPTACIVFFTLNGKRLGDLPAPPVPASEDDGEEDEEEEGGSESSDSGELFACVSFGFYSSGAEKVVLNFGDSPFKYVHKPAAAAKRGARKGAAGAAAASRAPVTKAAAASVAAKKKAGGTAGAAAAPAAVGAAASKPGAGAGAKKKK